MSDNKPMWTAARLNEFIARFGNVPVGLVPPGGIYRNEAIAWAMADEMADERVDRPSAVVPAMKKTPVADICCLDMRGLETATKNLARLPVLPQRSPAFDPEAWCVPSSCIPARPKRRAASVTARARCASGCFGSPFWARSEAAEMPIRSSIFWKPPMTPD